MVQRVVRSGITLSSSIISKVLSMVERGDRRHDIAAWFGLNQGRIKEVEKGDHGTPPLAPENQLPPSGSPGPKAQQLRRAVEKVRRILQKKGEASVAEALDHLKTATTEFDKNV